MKFTAIAASLLAAASTDNGNVDEKERKLNEMIMELQLLKEGLTIRRVSVIFVTLDMEFRNQQNANPRAESCVFGFIMT